MRPGIVRAWLRAGLAATLLLVSACQEPARGTAPAGQDGGPDGRVEAPAIPASERRPNAPEPPVGDAGEVAPPPEDGAAKRLKTEASLLVSAQLVSCQSGKVLARMSEPLLNQLRPALARAEVSRDTALTTPPWESALLELKFQDGQAVFGQLVREDVLRLHGERRCGGAREQGSELRLGDGPALFPWFQQHLGPVQSKEHRLPPGLPPPP